MESYSDILRVCEKGGCGLETISFLTVMKKAGSRRRAMCCVCLIDKDRKNATVEGKIIIQRNFIHIYLCVVAWEMEDPITINFLFYMFNFLILFQSKGESIKCISSN